MGAEAAGGRRRPGRPPWGVLIAAMFLFALAGVQIHAALFVAGGGAWSVAWLVLAAAMVLIAIGLLRLQPWARTAFLALLALSIAVEALFLFARQPGMSAWRILFAVALIVYLSRERVRRVFGG